MEFRLYRHWFVHVLIFTSLFSGAWSAEAAPGCLRRVVDAYKRIAATQAVLTGSATDKLSAEAFEIFEKVRRNPNYVPTLEESALLNSEGVKPLYDRYAKSSQFVKNMNHKLGMLDRSMPATKRKGWRKILSAWKIIFPFAPDFTQRQVENLFNKLAKDPTYQPTAKESKFLKKWNLADKFEQYRMDLAENQPAYLKLSQARTVGKYLKWGVVVSALTLAVLGEKQVDTEESFDEKSTDGMSKLDDKVELIFFSPMPHASIRIGGLVYNYGVFHVDRYTLEEFRTMVGFGKELSGNHTRVELKLTDEERHKLRDYLENDVGKVYPLYFPYNDCISQSNRAIKEACGIDVPPVADRSQAQTLAYFKLLKFLGSEKVGDIRFASKGNLAIQKAKDMSVNVVDSMFFLRSAGSMMLVTPVIDRMQTTFEVQDPEEDKTTGK